MERALECLDRRPDPAGQTQSWALAALRAARPETLETERVLDQAPNPMMVTDARGVLVFVNRRFSEVTGYAREEALGRNPRFLQSGDTPAEVYRDLWQTLLAGRTWRGEVENLRKNGERYRQRLAIAPILDDAGLPTHFLASAEDVTALRLMEASRLRLAQALEQTADGVAILEEDGTVEYANPAFHGILGLPAGAALGEAAAALLEDPDWPGRMGDVLCQNLEGRSWKGRHTVRAAQGRHRILDGSFTTLAGASGVVAVIRDVTVEEERQRHLAQAQKLDSLGAIAGGVAHDFNNLLSAILMAAENLETHLAPDSPALPRVDVIRAVCRKATELNRQILTFARRERGVRRPFELGAVVREAAGLLASTLPSSIRVHREGSAPVWVDGDPSQLHQVVMNLGVNAAHAIGAAEGRITLRLGERLLEPGAGGPLPAGAYAELVIRDTGRGMDAETLGQAFEPFFTTRAEGGGTGLGLSLVHGIILGHGGDIRLESTPGQGTVCRILLPCCARPEAQAAPHGPAEAPEGLERVLLVEDEDLVAALAKQGLEALGYEVVAKTSPADALEAFQGRPGGFDILVTDLVLPGFSGAQLAQKIRRLRSGLPAILVTSTLHDLEPGVSPLFDEVLPKPVSGRELGAAIRRVFANRQAGAEYPEPEPTWEVEGRPEILLADDSQVTRALVRAWMERCGYRVRETRDGQEAWEHFVAAQGRAPFAMVFTDIVMPRMDGLELVERIRKADPDVPVAVLSTGEDAEVGMRALKLHVDAFLPKPFGAEALEAVLTRLNEGRMSRARKDRLEATAREVRRAHKVMEAVPEKDLPVYSIQESLTDAGGDVFRCLRQPDGRVRFVLADVAGHSVMSSYAVAAFLGMLSTFRGEDLGPAALFREFNQAILDGPFPDIPIAALAAEWSPATGRFHVVSAGIPHGLHHRKREGRTRTVALDGAPLGLLEAPRMSERILLLEPGDRLLFATDGLFDAAGAGGARFRDLAPGRWQALAGQPVAQALGALGGAARSHAAAGLDDDLLAFALEQPGWLADEALFLRSVPSTLEAIENLCCEFDAFLGALDGAVRFRFNLALREALSNAERHGNQGQASARIGVMARWLDQALELRILDDGPGFDPRPIRPCPEPAQEGGRGLALLQAAASELAMTPGELTMILPLDGGADGL